MVMEYIKCVVFLRFVSVINYYIPYFSMKNDVYNTK